MFANVAAKEGSRITLLYKASGMHRQGDSNTLLEAARSEYNYRLSTLQYNVCVELPSKEILRRLLYVDKTLVMLLTAGNASSAVSLINIVTENSNKMKGHDGSISRRLLIGHCVEISINFQ